MESLAEARRTFQDINNIKDAEEKNEPDHPALLPSWLVRNAEARGSLSTILVVETDRWGRNIFTEAVGDTCLFLLEGFTLKESFPITSADVFTSFPPLIHSVNAESIQGEQTEFSLRPYHDPSILLVTDGLAEYLLALKPGKKRREAFSFLYSCRNDEFTAWAEEGIHAGAMKNDDLTLLWVREE